MDSITCEKMVLSDVYMQNESVKRQRICLEKPTNRQSRRILLKKYTNISPHGRFQEKKKLEGWRVN